MQLDVFRLGRVEYEDGLKLQQVFQAARRASLVPDTLVLLEHPAVLTLGRAAKKTNIIAPPSELARLGVEVFETDRGGDVTYHGPGQIVGYPLLFLPPGKQDVRKYVRSIEEVIIRALRRFSIDATRMPQWPGVWVEHSRLGGPRKIAALGVHLSRWHTRHGFALNVTPNLEHFSLIVPCGIREAGVTSMAVELDSAPAQSDVERALISAFAEVFEVQSLNERAPIRTVNVVVRRAGRVLLLKRTADRGGFWQTVTGHVEPHETANLAAQRELEEETGLTSAPTPLECVHAFSLPPPLTSDGAPAAAPVLAEETAFVADAQGDEIRLDPREHEVFEWVEPSQALERLPFAGLKIAVRRAFTIEGEQRSSDGHRTGSVTE